MEAMPKEFLTRQIGVFFEMGMLHDGVVCEEVRIADKELREKVTYTLVEHLVNNWEQNRRAKETLIERATQPGPRDPSGGIQRMLVTGRWADTDVYTKAERQPKKGESRC